MTLHDADWHELLARLKAGTCTPIVGAAVHDGILPLTRDLARVLAKAAGYPDGRAGDTSDLAQVTQALAIKYRDAMKPKDLMLATFEQSPRSFDDTDDAEPLNVLAKLPCPVYLTTTYDDALSSAILYHGQASGRTPTVTICPWNARVSVPSKGVTRRSLFKASAQTPVMYHLYGHHSLVDSLVLTEDDYYAFLVHISKDLETVFPPSIRQAIRSASLLVMGYRGAEIAWKVLLRLLRQHVDTSLRSRRVVVQLPEEDAHPNRAKAEQSLTESLGTMTVRVYWGTAQAFAQELSARWQHEQG